MARGVGIFFNLGFFLIILDGFGVNVDFLSRIFRYDVVRKARKYLIFVKKRGILSNETGTPA